MRHHPAWIAALWLAVSNGLPGALLAQEPPADGPARPTEPSEEEIEVTTASPEDLATLLGVLRSARGSDDATEIAAALAPLSIHDNPELVPEALAALNYRASKLDKRAAEDLAEELGTTSKNEVKALIAERESGVQAAAAHILANFKENKKALRGLEKAFKDKRIRSDKPLVVAALIRAFGRIGHGKVEDDVLSQLRRGASKEVSRACVRYFGELPTREYRTVCLLAEMLDAPEPASVNSAVNPPAEFWQAAWESWNWTRRDVSWALKQITGEVFRPADGDHPSDAQKALAYLEEHRAELGLR